MLLEDYAKWLNTPHSVNTPEAWEKKEYINMAKLTLKAYGYNYEGMSLPQLKELTLLVLKYNR